MTYEFDAFTLDLSSGRLEGPLGPIEIDPTSWRMLCHFVANPGAIISKDDLIDACWGGRVVSDATIATALKSVRRAIGDDGRAQTRLRTLRGRGYRFEAKVRERLPGAPAEAMARAELAEVVGQKPMVAILPWATRAEDPRVRSHAQAVPAEIIVALSRVRSLGVVARDSSFRLAQHAHGVDRLAELVGATYAVSGTIEDFGARLQITVELSDTRSQQALWCEVLSPRKDEINGTRAEIVNAVLAALDVHIAANEAARVALQTSEQLDAWSAYHVGLNQLYRFNPDGNAQAKRFLNRAIALDPGFSSAYSALSFSYFTDAFLQFGQAGMEALDMARRMADQALDLDPLDPVAHFNAGRVVWLQGRPEAGLPMLDRAIELDPNFAKGFYVRGTLQVLAGTEASPFADLKSSIRLSPLDPLYFAVKGMEAIALMEQGDSEGARISLARSAQTTPRMHHMNMMQMSAVHDILGDRHTAEHWAQRARDVRFDASINQLFTALPFRNPGTRSRFEASLRGLGFPDGHSA